MSKNICWIRESGVYKELIKEVTGWAMENMYSNEDKYHEEILEYMKEAYETKMAIPSERSTVVTFSKYIIYIIIRS